jgi:hypothetical protein
MQDPAKGPRPGRRVQSLAQGTAAAILLASLAACGRPQPPDLRGEMTDAVSRLGVRPIYPLSESHRIGAVHLVDASVARPNGGLPSWQEGAILLTEELVRAFETQRSARPSVASRFAQSHQGLGTALRPSTTGQAFYRQLPATSGDAPLANSLSLAAMPGFTLASVDQAALGGFLPGLTASFFASLGLRHTSYLRMEAEGVEMADLPYDELRYLVASACNGDGRSTIFGGQGTGATGLVQATFNILDQQRTERPPPRTGGAAEEAVSPYLALMRRVFYLRGVRFIVDDSRVASAFQQLALQSTLQPGETPVTLPQLRGNTDLAAAAPQGSTPPPAGSPQAAAAANAAGITALQNQIEQLRTVLASGAGPQIGASFARAAATGVELVQLFDRPLAFGYQAVFVDARKDRGSAASAGNLDGFGPLCRAI